MAIYRELFPDELSRELLSCFIRTQVVTKCWRRVDGAWQIQDIAFIDDWSEQDYCEKAEYLKNNVSSGGFVAGAFCDGCLKGFVAVEPEFFGQSREYLIMSKLHVSQDMRGCGLGRALFNIAGEWAGQRGAKKLYLSANSSVESIAFYKALGCFEALEYNEMLVLKEPCDCQLECPL